MNLPVYFKLNTADKARALGEFVEAPPAQGGHGFVTRPKPVNKNGSPAFTCDQCGATDRMTESAGHDHMFCHSCILEQDAHTAGLARMATR